MWLKINIECLLQLDNSIILLSRELNVYILFMKLYNVICLTSSQQTAIAERGENIEFIEFIKISKCEFKFSSKLQTHWAWWTKWTKNDHIIELISISISIG